MAEIIITKENFEQEVIKSDKKVLVDFWASWCGPCMMLAPVVEEIANERDDIKVCKINIDDNEELAQKYGVMSIPTLSVFEKGEELRSSVGYKNKQGVLSFIDDKG